jgi:catechol 2,3-dioxygenase-like lactoylglutathione lyase family enzyme
MWIRPPNNDAGIDWQEFNMIATEQLKQIQPPQGLPFKVQKIGHVVLNVTDLERSLNFYVGVLGFRISDIYPDSMVPGGMAFMRCSPDHHGVALVGSAKKESARSEMHHMAFAVASLDEVFRSRDHLRRHGVEIVYEGRRRAGCQIAVEFLDPDGHHLEIYWGLDEVGSDGAVRPPEEWRQTRTLEEAVDDAPPGQDTSLRESSLYVRKF